MLARCKPSALQTGVQLHKRLFVHVRTGYVVVDMHIKNYIYVIVNDCVEVSGIVVCNLPRMRTRTRISRTGI